MSAQPLTALIADDEPALARALQAQLAQHWPELQVLALARHGVEAAEQIARLQPDLAFLDIQMPGLTGLEVAQGIEGSTRVVFVTAYDEYAVQAFEAAALDYLLKPVSAERLQRCIQRLRAALSTGATSTAAPSAEPAPASGPEPSEGALAATLQRLLAAHAATPAADAAAGPLRWVRASRGEWTQQVPVAEVRFFHADDKYTCVQTAEAEWLIRTPISELVQQLDPRDFVQIHRSTVLNLNHLEGTRRDENSRLFVKVRGHSAELPVSRAYVHLFKAM